MVKQIRDSPRKSPTKLEVQFFSEHLFKESGQDINRIANYFDAIAVPIYLINSQKNKLPHYRRTG